MKQIITGLFLTLAVCACAPSPSKKTSSPPPGDKLQGCQWQLASVDACLQIAWEKAPTATDGNALKFRLVGPIADKVPSELIDLSALPHVEIKMPDMGHGSDPIVVERVSPGLYRASNINFSMVGYWELSIQLREGDKKLDEAIVPIDIR